MEAGVKIWEHPGTMHAKVMVADDQVIVGTINYDAWALYRNLEIAILIDDPIVADDAVAQLVTPSIENSTPAINDFTAYEAARNWLWARLSYFL
jgi:phosphatidylserine/phosphatidylglycerophosphate/cardiolipin synthase-like enzyme